MINNSTINFDLGEQYWFDGDKFLSLIIRREIKTFSNRFNLLDDPTLNLLPECRHFARVNFLHRESLDEIANWCINPNEEASLDYDFVGLFFWEENELMFAKLFAGRFKEYVHGKTEEEIKEILTKALIDLEGASFKRLAMQKWG